MDFFFSYKFHSHSQSQVYLINVNNYYCYLICFGWSDKTGTRRDSLHPSTYPLAATPHPHSSLLAPTPHHLSRLTPYPSSLPVLLVPHPYTSACNCGNHNSTSLDIPYLVLIGRQFCMLLFLSFEERSDYFGNFNQHCTRYC